MPQEGATSGTAELQCSDHPSSSPAHAVIIGLLGLAPIIGEYSNRKDRADHRQRFSKPFPQSRGGWTKRRKVVADGTEGDTLRASLDPAVYHRGCVQRQISTRNSQIFAWQEAAADSSYVQCEGDANLSLTHLILGLIGLRILRRRGHRHCDRYWHAAQAVPAARSSAPCLPAAAATPATPACAHHEMR